MRRTLSLIGALLVATLLTAPRAYAQATHPDSIRRDSTKAPMDSVQTRLQRLEDEVQWLRRQLGDETRMAAHTRSRIGLTLTARIQTNVFANSNRTNLVDVPQTVLAPVAASIGPASPGARTFGMSLRQSRVGAAVSVDSVLGARFEGDIDLDFFGGVSNGPGDRRLFPEPRIRTARAQLHWQHTVLLVGSETPLISDLNPISVAAVGFPDFVGAGNLWNWLPQIRITRELGGVTSGPSSLHVAIQGAVLSPFTGSQNIAETDAVDAGERSARPFVEARLRGRWGAGDDGEPSEGETLESGGEVGLSGHYGWVRAGGPVMQHTQAVAADAHVAITRHIELRGEAYGGQLLRGLGGGGIGQNFGRPADSISVGPVLRDAAGWVQLNAQLHPTLIVGVGCGFDAVNPDDKPVRERNSTCAAHALYRPSQPVFMGFEVRTLQTRYSGVNYRATHFNLTLGFEL